MDINRIYIWICFFFCISLTAGGLLVFFKKRDIKVIPASPFLQYYLILAYTFGFYSLWTNVVVKIVSSGIQSPETITILGYLAVLGFPFLLIAVCMFMLWTVHLIRKKPDTLIIALVSLLFIMVLLVYLVFIRFYFLQNLPGIFGLIILLTCVFSFILLAVSELQYIGKKEKGVFLALILMQGLIQLPLYTELVDRPVTELIYIFLFFLINTSIGIYYCYSAEPLQDEKLLLINSFGSFLKQYGITKRESDIVMEICNGKTNQEIADKFYVTIQTIKDHTHRIYLKTNVKNRAQLTSLLRKYE